MKLFHRRFGQGPTLIIVHGLYGASDNWVSLGKEFARHFEVFIVDQRNHGQSPHSPDHNYPAMREDLREFMDDHHIDSAVLLGHSMGGKTVMSFAISYPERVNGLIVVDIAPKSYSTHARGALNHETIIEILHSINPAAFTRREDIDRILSPHISSARIRNFLMKNLKRKGGNRLEWKLNLEALNRNLESILEWTDAERSGKDHHITGFPVLFVRGGKSDYILPEDEQLIRQVFPYAEIRTIEGAGHWLHAEEPGQLLSCIVDFIFGQ